MKLRKATSQTALKQVIFCLLLLCVAISLAWQTAQTTIGQTKLFVFSRTDFEM
jgi:hypothetical protein